MLGFNVLAGAALAEKPISSATPAPSEEILGGDPIPREYVDNWRKRLNELEDKLKGQRELDREDANEILDLVNTVVYGVSADVTGITAEVSQLMSSRPRLKYVPQDTRGFGFGDVTIAGLMAQLRDYEARMVERMEQEEEEDLEFILLH